MISRFVFSLLVLSVSSFCGPEVLDSAKCEFSLIFTSLRLTSATQFRLSMASCLRPFDKSHFGDSGNIARAHNKAKALSTV